MRISRDEWGLSLAEVTARRGTCLRRQVGCFLVDATGRELALGYNGVAAGEPHCNVGSHACPGALAASGERLDDCEALHAEWNAIAKVSDTRLIDTCYVTVSPCVTCTKMLLNTGCRRIVFREPYTAHEEKAKALWLRDSRRSWEHVPRREEYPDPVEDQVKS